MFDPCGLMLRTFALASLSQGVRILVFHLPRRRHARRRHIARSSGLLGARKARSSISHPNSCLINAWLNIGSLSAASVDPTRLAYAQIDKFDAELQSMLDLLVSAGLLKDQGPRIAFSPAVSSPRILSCH